MIEIGINVIGEATGGKNVFGEMNVFLDSLL